MEMHDKIKALRKQYDLTLEEVGQAVGVGKSTVRKWENGDIANMRRDKISKLAKVLHVTPAYLLGWDETEPPMTKNNKPAAQGDELTSEEVDFIKWFRTLSQEQRDAIQVLSKKKP